MPETQHCGTCKVQRPADTFDGKKTCRRCRDTMKAWRARNKERVQANNRSYYAANTEAVKANVKVWATANADRLKETSRAWVENNRERVQESRRRWAEANPDKIRASIRQHYQNNKAYYAAKDQRRRALKQEATVEIFTKAELYEFWSMMGIDSDRCFYCGEDHEHDDHVVPLSLGGTHERRNLLPACGPCNDSKGSKPLSEWRGGIHEQEALWALGLIKEIAVAEPDSANPKGSLETGDTQFPFEKVS